MIARINRLLTVCLLAAASIATAQDPDSSGRSWQIVPPQDTAAAPAPLMSLLPSEPMGLGVPTPLAQRPRLTVALSPAPQPLDDSLDAPTLSWSLEAWEVNTASLAHIQCARATRTIESFLVEDCRFVDQPLPDDSANLVQVRGRWMAAPGLSVSAGAFAGQRRTGVPESAPLLGAGAPAGVQSGLPTMERVQGVNMNVSFGLRMGQIGDLLLDLQLERYRQAPKSFSAGLGLVPTPLDSPPGLALDDGEDTASAGQLGLAWRGRQFSADVTGQYRELPHWLGDGYRGEGFRSFDIELSWRAPARSSISVGISNVLDQVPDAASDRNMAETVDGIYGRIPYVRYKHDL